MLAHYLLGTTLLAAGEKAAAVEQLRKARLLAPRDTFVEAALERARARGKQLVGCGAGEKGRPADRAEQLRAVLEQVQPGRDQVEADRRREEDARGDEDRGRGPRKKRRKTIT